MILSLAQRMGSRAPARPPVAADYDDDIVIEDDTLVSVPPPPPPAQAKRKRQQDDDDDDDESEETEESSDEEEEAESSSESSSEEEEPPPKPVKKAAAAGVKGLSGLRRIANVAKSLKKKRAAAMRRNLDAAIDEIAPLLEDHSDDIAQRLESADEEFVNYEDGETRVRVCPVSDGLQVILRSVKNDQEWINMLSERIYDACEISIDFDEDGWLVVVMEVEDVE